MLLNGSMARTVFVQAMYRATQVPCIQNIGLQVQAAAQNVQLNTSHQIQKGNHPRSCCESGERQDFDLLPGGIFVMAAYPLLPAGLMMWSPRSIAYWA